MNKINDILIKWAEGVKVTLVFRLNGRAVIESFPDGIHIPNKNKQVAPLTEDLIGADGAGYKNFMKLRRTFGVTKCDQIRR